MAEITEEGKRKLEEELRFLETEIASVAPRGWFSPERLRGAEQKTASGLY